MSRKAVEPAGPHGDGPETLRDIARRLRVAALWFAAGATPGRLWEIALELEDLAATAELGGGQA